MRISNHNSLFIAAILGLACVLTTASPVFSEGVERPSIPQVPVVTLDLECPKSQVAGEITRNSATVTIASGTATNASLSAVIPAEATFVTASDAGTYQESTRTIRWLLGTQNPGSRSVTFDLRIAAPLARDTAIISTAELFSDQTVPVSATCATSIQSTPTLTLSLSSSSVRLLPGETTAITVTLANTGNEDATNSIIRLDLPVGLIFAGTNLRTQEFALSTLVAGKDTKITATITAAPGTPADQYWLTAQANADHAKLSVQKLAITVDQATIPEGTTLAADIAPPAGTIAPIGQVLGAETELAETGISFRDWLIIYCATLLITVGGTTLVFYPFPAKRR